MDSTQENGELNSVAVLHLSRATGKTNSGVNAIANFPLTRYTALLCIWRFNGSAFVGGLGIGLREVISGVDSIFYLFSEFSSYFVRKLLHGHETYFIFYYPTKP